MPNHPVKMSSHKVIFLLMVLLKNDHIREWEHIHNKWMKNIKTFNNPIGTCHKHNDLYLTARKNSI